jgi:hypothetical protein
LGFSYGGGLLGGLRCGVSFGLQSGDFFGSSHGPGLVALTAAALAGGFGVIVLLSNIVLGATVAATSTLRILVAPTITTDIVIVVIASLSGVHNAWVDNMPLLAHAIVDTQVRNVFCTIIKHL